MKKAILGILLLAAVAVPNASSAASAQESLTANVITYRCPSISERSAQRLEQNYFQVNRVKRVWIGTLYLATAADDPDRIRNYCKEIKKIIDKYGF